MERRKFTRFLTQDDAFAALRGNLTKIGKIYDISLKGLAFRYLAEKISNETFTRVDILWIRPARPSGRCYHYATGRLASRTRKEAVYNRSQPISFTHRDLGTDNIHSQTECARISRKSRP